MRARIVPKSHNLAASRSPAPAMQASIQSQVCPRPRPHDCIHASASCRRPRHVGRTPSTHPRVCCVRVRAGSLPPGLTSRTGEMGKFPHARSACPLLPASQPASACPVQPLLVHQLQHRCTIHPDGSQGLYGAPQPSPQTHSSRDAHSFRHAVLSGACCSARPRVQAGRGLCPGGNPQGRDRQPKASEGACAGAGGRGVTGVGGGVDGGKACLQCGDCGQHTGEHSRQNAQAGKPTAPPSLDAGPSK